MEVMQNSQRSTARVVYVDLDDEIDGEEDEMEFGVWLSKDGGIPVLCTSHCHEVSNKALDQTEEISRTFCSQRGADIVTQSQMCNADAVDEITQKWPHREPYAWARPSESGEFSRGRRRRNKERSNYAKALLRSDTELEKLSRKIRLEIQQSEMLMLAIEAERAANAGFLSFSARPSTFGPDPMQNDLDRNLRRRSTSSQETTPASQFRNASDNMLKPLELRLITEVIPQWNHLHSHMRTHLFRRKIHEAALIFSEKESSSVSPQWKAPFEHSASDIARQSIKFLGDFADSTVRKLRSHSQREIHSRAMCEATRVEKVMMNLAQGSDESSLFGPTLASHLSPRSHGERFWRPLVSVPHGLMYLDQTHALEISSTTPNVGSSLDMPCLRGSFCKPEQLESDRFCHSKKCVEMEMGLSSPSSRVQTRDAINCIESSKGKNRSFTGVGHSRAFATDEANQRSLRSVLVATNDRCRMDLNSIRHHKWHGHKECKKMGYESPVRLRGFRGHSETKNLADKSVSSCMLGESESHDITMVTLGEGAANHSLDSKLCKSSYDEEKKDCEHLKSDEHDTQKGARLPDYPLGLSHNCQDNDDIHSNETDGVSVPTKQGPGSVDNDSHDGSTSASASIEEYRRHSAATWEGDLSESTRVVRNTHSWPLQDLADPDFPLGTVEAYDSTWYEPRSCDSASVRSANKNKDANSSSENHAMCNTFPSADENFQSAVEEMLSRFSPNVTWRRDLYIGETDNDEFLNNYFYRTKVNGKSQIQASSHTERVCVGVDSLCHVIGVDVVCSGFRFIFPEQARRPVVMTSRQRSVSLDGRGHNEAPSSSSWYTTLEGMWNHLGSESSHEVDSRHFDPPYLRKASVTKH